MFFFKKNKIKISINETLDKNLLSNKLSYFIVKQNENNFEISEINENLFNEKDIFANPNITYTNLKRTESKLAFSYTQHLTLENLSNIKKNEMLGSEYLYKEVSLEIYDNDNNLKDSIKYEFSKLSLDFCYENLEERTRFFIYDEFIDQNMKQLDRYFSLIKKDIKVLDSSNNTSVLILSPLAFFNYLQISGNIVNLSLIEHLLINDGKNAIKFNNDLCKKDLFDNNLKYPVLHGLFYLRKVEDKYVSNNNILEFEDFYVKDTEINLPRKLEKFTILDKEDIIEYDNIFYKIPWVKLSQNL